MNPSTTLVIDKGDLRELVPGAQKIFENAESLFNEARLLMANGFFLRALVLHQIPLEECAKIEILRARAAGLLMGQQADIKELEAVLASHARKNRSNAYFLELSEEEQLALKAGDTQAAIKAFQELQKKFHLKANAAKNAALYENFKDGKFVAPLRREASGAAAKWRSAPRTNRTGSGAHAHLATINVMSSDCSCGLKLRA